MESLPESPTMSMSPPVKSPPAKPLPTKRKKAASPDYSSFPQGIWVKRLKYRAVGGAASGQVKEESSKVLKLLNLEDDSIEVTTEEIVSKEAAEVVAAALQHTLYKGEYYTQQQKIKVLEECIENRGTIAQLGPCHCVAHLELEDSSSRLRPHIAKLMDTVTSDNPTAENQVADVLISILEIIALFPKFQQVLRGNKVYYEKLGKLSSHCGSFEIHDTQSALKYTIDQVDLCGEIRSLKVILVMVCEIQSGSEAKCLANAHTAEVSVAQLPGRKLEGIAAITVMKNKTVMIFVGRVLGLPEQGYQCISFKPAVLHWFELEDPEEIETFGKVYYSVLGSLPQVAGLDPVQL